MELILFGYIISCAVIAALGNERVIGGPGAFIVSLLFSPLIGLIIVLSSTKNSTIEFQKKLLESQGQRLTSDNEGYKSEISFLSQQFKEGKITEDEYLKLLKKLGGL